MSENSMFNILPLVIGSPLLGFLFQAFLGKTLVDKLGVKVGRQLCGIVAFVAVALAFAYGVAELLKLQSLPVNDRFQIVSIFPWIDLASLKAPFELVADPLSLTMVLVVTGIGALIHLYATGYMAEEPDYPRFFTYLNLFIVAMLILVLAGNLPLLFVGWEGVGLCSYLLIGFWYKDLANTKAANKAFIVNRIGDFGFILGLFLLFCLMASQHVGAGDARFLSFDTLRATLVPTLQAHPGYAVTIALMLFVGACGKSAQFPLYSWLPDAMAGPTPVSALIHAATMVTAGIFLVNRMFPVFVAAPLAGTIMAGIGAFTAIFAALIAFGQTDIKKVLAFSTVSQLGYMFVACGAGAYGAGMFHVVTHAFFKALLFLGSGAVIHAMAHNQDMRNYGNLRKYLPITFVTMLIGFLALSGFPLLAGFWSKEAILGAAIGSGEAVIRISGFVALVTAFLTAVYMARLTGLTFFGKERWTELPAEAHHAHAEALAAPLEDEADARGFYWTREQVLEREAKPAEEHHDLTPDHKPHEVSVSMWLPLVILAVPSLVAGWLLSENKFSLQEWLYPTGYGLGAASSAEVPWLTWVSGGAAVLGIAFGLATYWKGLPSNQGWDMSKWAFWRRLAADQFHWDAEVSAGASVAGKSLGIAVRDGIEPMVIETAVNGTGAVAQGLGLVLRKFQSGFVRFYALVMLIGVLGLLGYLFYLAHLQSVVQGGGA